MSDDQSKLPRSVAYMGKPNGVSYLVRKRPVVVRAWRPSVPFDVCTLDGTMHGNADDWLIMGVNGELYPCKPDIFEKTYDVVEVTITAEGTDR